MAKSDKTWEWIDGESTRCDFVAACVKDGHIVFRIKEARDCFFTDYYDNSLFRIAKLPYYKAAQMAENEFGSDSIENRLKVAKMYFLEDYKEQVQDKLMMLQSKYI